MHMTCSCGKLMMNDVVVVELGMNTCSNVVVVVVRYVVVELMHWVSWTDELVRNLLLLLKVEEVWCVGELLMD